MKGTKILGIVLLAGGILGLIYGHFDYTKETHKGQIGPLTFSISEKETTIIPGWVSIAAIIAGAALLVFDSK